MDRLAAGDVSHAVLAILGRRTGGSHASPVAARPAPVFSRHALPLPPGPRS